MWTERKRREREGRERGKGKTGEERKSEKEEREERERGLCCVDRCFSLTSSQAEHIFRYLLVIRSSSSIICLFIILAQFPIRVFFPFLLIYKSSL